MKICYTNNTTYDFRVVKCYDATVDVATHGRSKALYVLHECHYDKSGKLIQASVINDMTSYGRHDAKDFLLRLSSAILKPVIDKDGNIVEESLIDPGKAVLSYLGG